MSAKGAAGEGQRSVPTASETQLQEGDQTVKLDQLREADDNPRKITEERLADLMYAVERVPDLLSARPLIATPDGEVIAGNMRLRAMRQLGWSEAPVFVKDFSTRAERREWALLDNNPFGDYVPEELAAQVAAQRDEQADLRLLGFGEGETDALLKLNDDLVVSDPEEEEPAPEPPREAVVKEGEIWQLGPHRLACGSSVDETLIKQLLASTPIAPKLLTTDPPFGVELEMEWRDDAGFNSERFKGAKDEKAIRGRKPTAAAEESYLRETGRSTDTRADWSEAYALVDSLRVAYVWHADRFVVPVITGLESIGFRFVQQIIWDKEILVLSRTIYHFRHEPCVLAVKRVKGEPSPQFYGKQDQHTIWPARSPKRLGAGDEEKMPHPTQKPVVLFETPARNHLRRGEALYDPFMGSGTALMAAERSDRIAVGVELNPGYMDVAIERWENATGEKAQRHASS